MLRETISAASSRLTRSFASSGTVTLAGGLDLQLWGFRVLRLELRDGEGIADMGAEELQDGVGIGGA